MQSIINLFNQDLSKEFLYYILVTIIVGIIGFSFSTYLSYLYTPSDFGKIALFNLALTLMTPVVGISINSITSRNYFNKSRNELNELFSNQAIAVFFSLIIFTLIYLTFKDNIQKMIGLNNLEIITVFACSFFAIFYSNFMTILQLEKKILMWGYMTVGMLAINIFITLISYYLIKQDYTSRIIAILISNFTILFFCFYNFIKLGYSFNFKINKNSLKEILYIGGPLVVVNFLGWGISSIGKVMTKMFFSLEMLGIYSYAITLSAISEQLIIAFSRAWSPNAYKMLSENKFDLFFKMGFVVFLFMVIITAASGFFVQFVFQYFLADDLLESLKYIPIISVGFGLYSFYKIFTPYVNYIGKTYVLNVFLLFGILAYVLFSILLKNFEIYGITVSFILCSVSIVIIYGSYLLLEYKKLKLNK